MKRLTHLTCAMACTAAAFASQNPLQPKQVAAPAEDLLTGRLRLPEPREVASTSAHSLHSVLWEEGRARLNLAVPEGSLRVGIVSRAPLQVRLAGDKNPLAIEGVQAEVGLFSLPHTQVHHVNFLPSGDYGLELWGGSPGEETWVVARDDEPLQAEAWIDTWQRTSDRELPVRARLRSTEVSATSAWLILEDGRRLALRDDGEGADAVALDGTYSLNLPVDAPGRWRAQVEVQGVSWRGAFQRSVPLNATLHPASLRLAGNATTAVLDAKRLGIDLPVWNEQAGRRVQLSAEVWGHDVHGHPVPVCWLSRMQSPLQGERSLLSLRLDARWLGHAAARPPLELREVRVQDPDTHAVLDGMERLPLSVPALPPLTGQPVQQPDAEMLMGGLSTPVGNLPGQDVLGLSPSLMLVHGYCSGGNTWPASSFSQPRRVFFDPNQNRSHDEFAQLLITQSSGLTSFGVVGHSQGGAAALHLYTYYQSPLDQAQGARRIQSVATPYQGTPLASLGAFACGVNDDLTPAGSAAWLAGIPSWARAEVTYWTVSGSSPTCNFLASLFLSDPEDGTVEVARGQLPGATNMGNRTNWCHTSGMSYPSCTTDGSRNAEMDAEAAR